MIIKDELQINHYLVRNDSDTSYKEDYFYAPVKGEDAKRHRYDGPALVYKSKTEEMNYFEWWDEGKMVATFNSKTNTFKKSENGTFMGLQEVNLPEKWKGLEQTLSLSDVRLCNDLVIKTEEEKKLIKEEIVSNIQNLQEKFKGGAGPSVRHDVTPSRR